MDEWKLKAVDKVARARTDVGLGQIEAARRANISQGYWSLVETGCREPSYDVLRRMCLVVGLQWSDPKVGG
jgi:predicted transcriptional regulator